MKLVQKNDKPTKDVEPQEMPAEPMEQYQEEYELTSFYDEETIYDEPENKVVQEEHEEEKYEPKSRVERIEQLKNAPETQYRVAKRNIIIGLCVLALVGIGGLSYKIFAPHETAKMQWVSDTDAYSTSSSSEKSKEDIKSSKDKSKESTDSSKQDIKNDKPLIASGGGVTETTPVEKEQDSVAESVQTPSQPPLSNVNTGGDNVVASTPTTNGNTNQSPPAPIVDPIYMTFPKELNVPKGQSLDKEYLSNILVDKKTNTNYKQFIASYILKNQDNKTATVVYQVQVPNYQPIEVTVMLRLGI
ncbi:MAG: hypothetical protein LBV67_06295 [Streptococcaceae bacterium]|jgi:hypothetical protein|nr:hypothetical protein [Streptococcaceae bacterium]